MRKRQWLCVMLFMTVSVSLLHAQDVVIPGSERDDYVRFLQLNGWVTGTPLVFRSPSSLRGAVTQDSAPWTIQQAAGAGHTTLALLPWEVRSVYNSAFPWGINDGALWAGRGGSFAVSGGASVRAGPARFDLYPTLWYASNGSFQLAPQTDPRFSTYAYPWHLGRIDWPQRFGNGSVSRFDPGQTGVRIDLNGLTLGASSENMVWGPAIQNPIIMSANAAGFPHVDFGAARPLRTPIGHVEFRLVWGRLTESQFFDTVSGNNHRLFTGLTFGFSPRGLPGLTLGVTRVLYSTWTDSLHLADYIEVFQPFFKNTFSTSTNPEGNDDRDQMLSLVARWAFPAVGFEAYLEWARNDHSANLRDFILEPDHSQAFTTGVGKTLGASRRTYLRGEITHLERSPTFQVRPTPSYYVHHLVTQGYTELGQIIGAGIGPGSNSQYLAVDRYSAAGRWGVFVSHVSLDEDALYSTFEMNAFLLNDVQLTVGFNVLRRISAFEVGGRVGVTREYNREFVRNNDVTNLNLQLTLRWSSPAQHTSSIHVEHFPGDMPRQR